MQAILLKELYETTRKQKEGHRSRMFFSSHHSPTLLTSCSQIGWQWVPYPTCISCIQYWSYFCTNKPAYFSDEIWLTHIKWTMSKGTMATTPRKWIGRVQVTTNQTMATTDEEQECVKVEGTACQYTSSDSYLLPKWLPLRFQEYNQKHETCCCI